MFGSADRFADFFIPMTKVYTCNKHLQSLEQKLVRMHSNYPGRYASRSDDQFAFLIEQGEFSADIVRQIHTLT